MSIITNKDANIFYKNNCDICENSIKCNRILFKIKQYINDKIDNCDLKKIKK